jgi:hypothetical protein
MQNQWISTKTAELFLISVALGRTVGQLDFALADCLFISHMEVDKVTRVHILVELFIDSKFLLRS